MTAGARALWLGTSLLPYLTLVSVDAWMHERARKVPRTEQLFHALAALTLLGFLVSVFTRAAVPALAFLAAFLVCTACDEIGFHRGLSALERRVHFAAYAALGVFLAMWRWIEGGA